MLKQGKIVAVKGLGGFHLVCYPASEAVSRLRRLKGRESKPLAVMCRDIDCAKRYCSVSEGEEKLLNSPRAPIVVLEQKEKNGLPGNLSGGLKTLGVMLPYTPLHLLLFDEILDLLVVTSANLSGLPLVIDNQTVLTSVAADAFLVHDREIVNRCDDSLAAVIGGKTQIWRRSRGYVPEPVAVPLVTPAPILGAGAELKNTFCLLQGDTAFLSQHLGDLETAEAQKAYLQALRNMEELLEIAPEGVAYDLHPGYNSSRLASSLEIGREFPVQHHHAHFSSCLAENKHQGPALGVILDGTGYGTDGASWGFELIAGDYHDFRRLAHLDYVPLPGSDTAIRYPWRIAAAYLVHFLGEKGEKAAASSLHDDQQELKLVLWQLRQGINAPLSGGCGRLFDAVAAFLGICLKSDYEGQAAAQLSDLACYQAKVNFTADAYCLPFEDGLWNPAPLWEQLYHDRLRSVDRSLMAVKFHNALANAVVEGVCWADEQTGLKTVALSGGVWQNKFLSTMVPQKLEERGYQVLRHRLLPPNDGGLSLGQAMVAAERWKHHVSSCTDAGD